MRLHSDGVVGFPVRRRFGMTSQTLVLSREKLQTDEELVASLAQGDEHKAAMLRTVLGKDGFGDGKNDE